MTTTRPFGVSMLTVILGIGAIANLVMLLFASGPAPRQTLLPGQATYILVFLLALSALSLALAWGLWTLQPWARNSLIAIEVVYFIFGIFAYVGQVQSVAILSFLIVLALLLTYTIYNRHVRRAFGDL